LYRAVKFAALEDGVYLEQWIADALEAYLATVGRNPGTAADKDSRKAGAASKARRARASA
jgi:hypothetical protein